MDSPSLETIEHLLQTKLLVEFDEFCSKRQRIRRELLRAFWKLEKKCLITALILSLLFFNRGIPTMIYAFLGISLIGLYPIVLILVFNHLKPTEDHDQYFKQKLLEPFIKLYYADFWLSGQAVNDRQIAESDIINCNLFSPQFEPLKFVAQGTICGQINHLKFSFSAVNSSVFNGIFLILECPNLYSGNTQVFPNLYRWRPSDTSADVQKPDFITRADYPNVKLNDAEFNKYFVLHSATPKTLDQVFSQPVKDTLLYMQSHLHFYTLASFLGSNVYLAIPRNFPMIVPYAFSLDSSPKPILRTIQRNLNEMRVIEDLLIRWEKALFQ